MQTLVFSLSATQDTEPARPSSPGPITSPIQGCSHPFRELTAPGVMSSPKKSVINTQGDGEALEQAPGFPFQPSIRHSNHYLQWQIVILEEDLDESSASEAPIPSHPIPSRRHPVAVPSWRNHPEVPTPTFNENTLATCKEQIPPFN